MKENKERKIRIRNLKEGEEKKRETETETETKVIVCNEKNVQVAASAFLSYS